MPCSASPKTSRCRSDPCKLELAIRALPGYNAPMSDERVEPNSPQMVCRRILAGDPARRKSAEYQGRTIYFCTGFCLEAFLADPDRFYLAHSRPRPK